MFSIHVTLKRKTDAAMLGEDGNGDEVWIPHSAA